MAIQFVLQYFSLTLSKLGTRRYEIIKNIESETDNDIDTKDELSENLYFKSSDSSTTACKKPLRTAYDSRIQITIVVVALLNKHGDLLHLHMV